MKNYQKYKAYQPIQRPHRRWPDQQISKAPVWCSVDLRDGNQALEIPMSLAQKIRFFQLLVDLGFKQIEIGFPAASDTEYAFTRYLIEHNLIPDDVWIQVLTQSRPDIITKTFEALQGVNKAIVHLYNSTSVVQRDVVFRMSRGECRDLAIAGARHIKELAEQDTYGSTFMFEYSPESFTGTEMDFAVEVCDAVCDVWQPTAEQPAIINLPATVEMSTPNIYADQIEFFTENTRWRSGIQISLHPHNDRGTGVAATEFGLMAGADRVEGTLFGNGERTGNADIITLALNMFSQGVDPQLDFSDINEVIRVYEESTNMQVPPRHPYAGELVYTAFSGSHQDAIKKGMARVEIDSCWQVPYLPIDPIDVGRSYDPIIRINSQSGKGGVAFVLERSFGLQLPRYFQQAFSREVTRVSDHQHKDMKPDEIHELFQSTYVNLMVPIKMEDYREEMLGENEVRFSGKMVINEKAKIINAHGNGLLDAFTNALQEVIGRKFEIADYSEHALTSGSKSKAITYVKVLDDKGKQHIGAGISSSISKSSLRAVISAVNRMLTVDEQE